ncbi:MAG: putative motility protein [Oscillospiraceae bacterium]|nr:putative motility protein [Oscillospiraceae bacterium]
MMSVAAMSISMHQGQLQQAVSVSLMREVMDQQTAQAAALVEDIAQSVPSTVPGSRLDILA